MLYTIKKLSIAVSSEDSDITKAFGIPDGLNEAEISLFPWDKNGFCPKSGAFVGWDESGIHVWLYSLETDLRAEAREFCSRVCDDSCLEFFFQPDPDHIESYINYECSPLPCVYLAVGASRHERINPEKLPEGLEPSVKVIPGYGWSVHYVITSAWLLNTFGVKLNSGYKMRGNFFKCGDRTPCPHFGVWSPIDTRVCPKPDFHRPEYFSDLILE